jgi:hypothetical protein
MSPDSPSELFCSGKCTEKADEVIAQAQKMVASMPIGPDGPIMGGFTVGQLADLLRMDHDFKLSLLGQAVAGEALTTLLDTEMVMQAQDAAVWRYSTPLEVRCSQAWATYVAFMTLPEDR